MVHCILLEFHGIRLPDETARIETVIRECGAAFAFTKSTWIVESELGNAEIGERLARVLRAHDRFVVTRMHKDWIAANLTDEETDWLGSRNYTSTSDAPPFPR